MSDLAKHPSDIAEAATKYLATSKLRKGDTANLTVGKFGSAWHVLETGNVYSEGTVW